jgi:hypothetical protein
MPQGEARGALKPRVDRLGEGKKREYKYSILLSKRKILPFLPSIWVAPLLIHLESDKLIIGSRANGMWASRKHMLQVL